MPPSSPTSFIGKQALERPNARPAPLPIVPLFVLALIVLFISGIVLGGALAYRSLLTTEITAPCSGGSSGDGSVERCGLRATVDRERKNIDEFTTRMLQRLDRKLTLASDLLKTHQSILPVFDLIQKNTLPSVRYSSFNYSPKNITLDGTAGSFEDIAVQTGVWNEAKKQNEIQSFIFSDLNQGSEGETVTFKLTLVINPSLTVTQSSL